MADKEETLRQSRAALSRTQSVPEWLLTKYPLPSDVQVHHTVHKDSTLPLFQGRLGNGEIYESKTFMQHLRHPFCSCMC